MARRLPAGWWLASPSALLLAAFPAFTGHAAGAGDLRSIRLLADTLHVWAAGGWIGTLTAILSLTARRSADSPPSPSAAALVGAFSPVAMACVGILVLSGTFAAWAHLPELGALVTTSYGRRLSLKLVLVAAVVGLGAINNRKVAPRLGSDAADGLLVRTASLEIALAQAVLIVTAILVRTPPS